MTSDFLLILNVIVTFLISEWVDDIAETMSKTNIEKTNIEKTNIEKNQY
jgi:hypothetical protein